MSPVESPWYDRRKTPPAGVPVVVIVCTSSVPAEGAPADWSGVPRPVLSMIGISDPCDRAERTRTVDRQRQARLRKDGDLVLDEIGRVLRRHRDRDALAAHDLGVGPRDDQAGALGDLGRLLDWLAPDPVRPLVGGVPPDVDAVGCPQ